MPGPGDDDVWTVPLAHLLALCDPRGADVWNVGPISAADVTGSLGSVGCATPADSCRACHVERVARFFRDGVPRGDEHPVSVDLGLGDYMPEWPVVDGNHRVLAAALRGDVTIEVAPSGDLDRAEAFLLRGAVPSVAVGAEEAPVR